MQVHNRAKQLAKLDFLFFDHTPLSLPRDCARVLRSVVANLR